MTFPIYLGNTRRSIEDLTLAQDSINNTLTSGSGSVDIALSNSDHI